MRYNTADYFDVALQDEAALLCELVHKVACEFSGKQQLCVDFAFFNKHG
jgi:hypothetical protein